MGTLSKLLVVGEDRSNKGKLSIEVFVMDGEVPDAIFAAEQACKERGLSYMFARRCDEVVHTEAFDRGMAHYEARVADTCRTLKLQPSESETPVNTLVRRIKALEKRERDLFETVDLPFADRGALQTTIRSVLTGGK